MITPMRKTDDTNQNLEQWLRTTLATLPTPTDAESLGHRWTKTSAAHEK